MYPNADELVAKNSDTNLEWESMLTRDLAEEILGRTITVEKWEIIVEALDDAVFETVMAFQHDEGRVHRSRSEYGKASPTR